MSEHRFTIGVVDDEAASRALLIGHLERYAREESIGLDVRAFADARELVDGYRADFDVIFLDVQMDMMDGFEAAHAIREVDQDVVIVFVTNMAQFAIRGYEVDALSYLVKPVPYFAFTQEFKRSLARARQRDVDSFIITSGSTVMRLDLASILYVESVKHRITVHTTSGPYSYTGTLKAVEADLVGKGFYRSNNCYVVSLRHVTGVGLSTCTMRGEVELQVSRPRRKGFLEALTDYVGGHRG
jgi:DNA-binding LytR/AlgR family response regulator